MTAKKHKKKEAKSSETRKEQLKIISSNDPERPDYFLGNEYNGIHSQMGSDKGLVKRSHVKDRR